MKKNNSLKPLLSSLGCIGIAATTSILGGPLFASSLSLAGSVVNDIFNNLAGNIASDQLLKINPNALRKFWTGNKHDISNHDLFKALKQSLIVGMESTEMNYKIFLGDKSNKYHLKAIRNKIKTLCQEVDNNFEKIFDSEEDQEQYITDDKILRFEEGYDDSLYSKFKSFLEIDKLEGHGEIFFNFFKEQLPYNILAAFSEILKTNQRAWVAYQRLILTDLLNSNQRAEDRLEEVLNQIHILKQQLESIETISKFGGDEQARMLWERFTEVKEYYNFSIQKLESYSNTIDVQLDNIYQNLQDEFLKQARYRLETTKTLAEIKSSLSKQENKQNDNDIEYLEKTVLPKYLEWMHNTYASISLPAIDSKKSRQSIPLEKVYVALQLSDEKTHQDFQYGSQLIKRQIKEAEASKLSRLTEKEKNAIRSTILQKNPTLSNFKRTVLAASAIEGNNGIVSLGKVFQDERHLLILGDPGSGKSTLVKWLALQLTKGLLENQERVKIDKDQISDESASEEDFKDNIFDLGYTRLPVLIKIPEYTKFYDEFTFDSKNYDLSRGIIDFCGLHLPTIPSISQSDVQRLVKHYLVSNKAVFFLDGMDEVIKDRDKIIDEIEKFIKYWININNNQFLNKKPIDSGGNQIIITSRIVGYHAAPLRSEVTDVYVREMNRSAIESFCALWTKQVLQEDLLNTEALVAKEIIEKETEALQAAIFDDSKPRIRELATNPLLVTILALLFKVKNNELPKSRVELYEQSISILMGKWKNLQQSKDSISEKELNLILQAIAEYIHSSPSEDVREEDMIDILEGELRLLRGIPEASITPTSILDQVETFIKVIKEDVGLLSERGERLYHFLHRTFQEYLAGKRLVVNDKSATQNIIDRLSDPVWREPVLLSVAYANKYWSASKFNFLIDSLLSAEDNLKDLVPRGILLVATALPDMDRLSPDLFQKLVKEFLEAFGNREGIGRFESIRNAIKTIIDNLRKSERKKLFFDACEHLLKSSIYTDVQWALISLCAKDEWYKEEWIKLVIPHLEEDSAEWDWCIDLLLQKYFSSSKIEDNRDYLLFRNHLLNKPKYFKIILNNPHWQRLIMVLYGGWAYDKSAEEYKSVQLALYQIYSNRVSEDDKMDKAVYLDSNQKRIITTIKDYKYYFHPQYIHRTSPFTRLLLRYINANKVPQDLIPIFSDIWAKSDNMEHKSLSLLALGALGVNIEKIVYEANEKSLTMQKSIDRFMAHLKRIERNLSLPFVRFAYDANQASEYQKLGWQYLPVKYSSYVWSTLMETMGNAKMPANVCFSSLNEPSRKLYPDEKELVAQSFEAFIPREAESYMALLSTFSDDILYSTHVYLDTRGKELKKKNNEFILEALCQMPLTKSLNNPYHLGWEMPKFWMQPTTEYEKLLLAIRVIDGLPTQPLNYDGLREFFIHALWIRLEPYPELRILALTAFVGKGLSELIKGFFKNKLSDTTLESFLSEAIPKIKNPFIRFLAALNISKVVKSNKIENTIFESLDKIKKPEEWIVANLQAQMREVYVIVILKSILDGSVKEVVGKLENYLGKQSLDLSILAKAKRINNVENRFRTYLYAAEVATDGDRPRIIFSAMNLLPKFKEDGTRSRNLELLLSKFQPIATMYPFWEKINQSFSSNFDLNRGLSKNYANLVSLHKYIAKETEHFNDATTIWSVFTSVCMAQEVQKRFRSRDLENLILESLLDDVNNTDLWNNLINIIKDGTKVNSKYVKLIDKLYDSREFDMGKIVLSLLETKNVSDLRLLQHWETSNNKDLELFWHLINAENGILSPIIIDGIVEIIDDYSDRLSLRAQVAIHSENCGNLNRDRNFSTKHLGYDTLYYLYEKTISLEILKPRVSNALNWFGHNLIHDNTEMVDKFYYLHQNGNSQEKLVAKKVLSSFECTTKGVIHRIKYLLINNNHEDTFLLWKAIARLVYNENNFGVFRSISDNDLNELLENRNAVKAFRVFIDDYKLYSFDCIKNSFLELKQHEEKDTYNLTRVAKELIEYNSKIKIDTKALTIPNLRKVLNMIMNNWYFSEKRYTENSNDIANMLCEDINFVKLLAKLTLEELDNNLIDDDFSNLGGNLCLILAECSSIRPELLQTVIIDERSKAILIDTVKSSSSYISRKGAIQILSNLKKIDINVLEALIHALGDIDVVRDTAMSNLESFSEIMDEKTLEILLGTLNHTSAQIASETVKVLANISAQSALDVSLRKKSIKVIADALRKQINNPSERKLIYKLKSDIKTIFDEQSSIVYEEQFENVLYNELIRLTGL